MHQIKAIRMRLGLSQQSMGHALGCTQSNIGHYERGQMMPTRRARRLIDFASGLGLVLSFDHIYGDAPLPELAQPTTPIQEVPHA